MRVTDDSGLRRRVGRLARARVIRVERREVDDAPEAPIDHRAAERPRHVEGAVQVDAEDPLPSLRLDRPDVRRALDSRVVDEPVDVYAGSAKLCGERGDVALTGDVEGVELDSLAIRRWKSFEPRRQVRGAPITSDDLLSVANEAGDHGGAEPAERAG